MSDGEVKLDMTRREASLVLEYGYPFPEEEKKILKISTGESCSMNIGNYWLELIVGDLCRSMKEIEDESLLLELDALCDTLENAVNNPNTKIAI